jgi:hypothetical protein
MLGVGAGVGRGGGGVRKKFPQQRCSACFSTLRPWPPKLHHGRLNAAAAPGCRALINQAAAITDPALLPGGRSTGCCPAPATLKEGCRATCLSPAAQRHPQPGQCSGLGVGRGRGLRSWGCWRQGAVRSGGAPKRWFPVLPALPALQPWTRLPLAFGERPCDNAPPAVTMRGCTMAARAASSPARSRCRMPWR